MMHAYRPALKERQQSFERTCPEGDFVKNFTIFFGAGLNLQKGEGKLQIE